MVSKRVESWLFDDEQPAVRYLAMRQLGGRSESDSEVQEAKRRIPTTGWVAGILAERNPAGWWVRGENHYRPKYTSTNWKMLVLSDLGLTRENAAIRVSCELWMRMKPMQKGEPGTQLPGPLHHCVVGNAVRALIRFGYEDDPRVQRGLEWLVETANSKGGWSCFGSSRGPSKGRTLDSWEGLSALSAYPRTKRTASMQRAIDLGAEFYLERELHRQGARYPPWHRFHYPVHYYYDLLVGLDLLTALGYADDHRLRYALEVLRRKRRSDGRWNLDAVHPDVEGPIAAWYDRHPKDRPVPWALERPGQPSRMITLIAQHILERVEGTTGAS